MTPIAKIRRAMLGRPSRQHTQTRTETPNPREDLRDFLQRFREKYVSSNLIRIGGEGDGGYLLPNNLDELAYCFSPGVDYTANFEAELSKRYGIRSFMADASVETPPLDDERFEFTPKFLGARTRGKYITLSDWIEQTTADVSGSRILQMDIEGAEYDVLTYESSDTFAQFSSMIIEFHGVHDLFGENFLRMFSAIFEKIYQNFSICHVHPNNCCGIVERDGIAVPRIMEVTFIRNDLISTFSSNDKISLPHVLDSKNVESIKDIVMPEIWWKKD